MNWERFISGYEKLISEAKRLTELSTLQQQAAAKGDFSRFEEWMAERQCIVDAVIKNKNELDMLQKAQKSINQDPQLDALKEQLQQEIGRFVHVDTVTFALIERQANQTAMKFIEQIRKNMATTAYQHVERTTDVVARVFLGNSRKIDKNL